MNAFRQQIEKEKARSLSDREVEQMSGAKVLMYEDLYKYGTLESMLDANGGKVILLYISQDNDNYGHWTAIFKTKMKATSGISKVSGKKVEVIEWMDSYGLKPDEELKFSSARHGQDFKQLSKLMIESPYILTYNEFKFQKDINPATMQPITTCGHHVVARLNNSDKTLIEYKAFLKKIIKDIPEVKDYDDAVSVLYLRA